MVKNELFPILNAELQNKRDEHWGSHYHLLATSELVGIALEASFRENCDLSLSGTGQCHLGLCNFFEKNLCKWQHT